MHAQKQRKEERDTFNENSLRLSLITQPREGGPRLQIKKKDKELRYEDLEKMTLEELAECSALLLGKSLHFGFNDRRDQFCCVWSYGLEQAFEADRSAIEILEGIYELALSALAGP